MVSLYLIHLGKMKSPADLPLVPIRELSHEGGFKLNPFKYNGKTYRIVGYDRVTDMHSLKNVDAGTYSEVSTGWLKIKTL